jgi:DNA (cytosine-5)-methyltransferase 1
VKKLNVLDLFSGIGGFSLGLERAGMRTVAFCEINPHGRAVLAKHWPGVPCYDDITKREFREGEADVICGGFPCQDISAAGNRAGLAGERSGLWRELLRAIRVVRPIYAIVENVAALLNRGMGTVLGDLAEIGQDAEWNCIPARAVGAPHIRDRVWIVAADPARGGHGLDGLGEALQRQLNYPGADVADADSVSAWGLPERTSSPQPSASVRSEDVADPDREREPQSQGRKRIKRRRSGDGGSDVPDAIGERVHVEPISITERSSPLFADGNGAVREMADAKCFGCLAVVEPVAGRAEGEGATDPLTDGSFPGWWRWWATEPDVGRVAHGVPARVDRLKGLGNAVVPQIPEAIPLGVPK